MLPCCGTYLVQNRSWFFFVSKILLDDLLFPAYQNKKEIDEALCFGLLLLLLPLGLIPAGRRPRGRPGPGTRSGLTHYRNRPHQLKTGRVLRRPFLAASGGPGARGGRGGRADGGGVRAGAAGCLPEYMRTVLKYGRLRMRVMQYDMVKK